MTELLLVIAMVLLLIAALAPAHRRARHSAPANRSIRLGQPLDRDAERITAELAGRGRRDHPLHRSGQLLGEAGRAVPFHRPHLLGH
jgi:hypothetical protein